MIVKVGIVGVTGYGGIELYRLLSQHPHAEIVAIKSNSSNGELLRDLYPHLGHVEARCEDVSPEDLAAQCDVIFTATPHGGASLPYVEPVKKHGKKLIDLSADFRLVDAKVYEQWYCPSDGKAYFKDAVYGMPELHKEEIVKAWLIANPGCYTTASILANAPLVAAGLIDVDSLVIDAKSGVSGAGRKPKDNLHYPEMNEGFAAYGIGTHRHTPEIEQELGLLAGKPVVLNFTPHLTPMTRGILATSYSKLVKNSTEKEIYAMYNEFYEDAVFVRMLEDGLPNTKFVSGTNFVDIAIKIDQRTNRVIVVSAIDNLVKGASGQAVQNMNLAFGLDETAGLNMLAVYP